MFRQVGSSAKRVLGSYPRCPGAVAKEKEMLKRHRNTIEKLLGRCEQVTESGCWIFLGSLRRGYAVVRFQGKGASVHRLFYEHFVGPIPEGLQIDHLCRVRCCVNPAHLEPVTAQINSHRSNSFTGLRARQTACKYGHPLERITWPSNSRRICRECNRIRSRKYYYEARTRGGMPCD